MTRLAFITTIILSIPTAQAQVGSTIWFEGFDSLNTNHWNVVTGNGCPELCYWGNFEHQYYDEANVYTDTIPGEPENRGLVIEAKRESKGGMQFTSGRLNTKEKLEIRYGVIDVRMRVPDLETGLWPAFWLLGANNPDVGWPQSGEIDMMEMGHKESYRTGQGQTNSTVNNFVGANVIWYAEGACNANNPTCAAAIAGTENYYAPYVPEEPMNDRFVTYRLYWNSNELRFTVIDGEEEIGLYTAPFSFTEPGEIKSTFTKPFYLIMNLAVGGNFTDASTPQSVSADLPAKMYIDYIKVSKYGSYGEVTVDGMVVPNEGEKELPENFKLKQNYPNPFNPSTTIDFELSKASRVKISVFDITGRKVSDLTNSFYSLGSYSIRFDASDLPTGLYYYTMEADGFSTTKKMILIK
ncbi:MAG: family 16 glycosylhydrolase [Balneolaceae bacterium]|nr:family 16 glycosylhydrolase [Balneolaceae bacterium]MBO6544837.1 family 16 glycosylhydrolase [Balneolaceae bacterium]MBO6646233.1 family 16 glycosylhydrolase [Balneolaceae bacterium]